MKQILSNVLYGLSMAALLWLGISTIDVNMHNLTDYDYADWNIWTFIIDVDEQIYTIEDYNPVRGKPEIMITNELVNSYILLGKYKLTGYCSCASCCGKTDGITASGTYATQGRTVAVDPRKIPYGTELVINGQTYIAEDCGGLIKGNRIDIFFANHSDALKFGTMYANVYEKR